MHGLTRGCVELTIDGEGDKGVSYTLNASGGRVTIADGTAERLDARVSGTTEAWVAAFSPGGNTRGLRITGDENVAKRVLEGLGLSDGRSEGEAAA